MINIHQKTLQDLEFATVLNQVSEYCITALGNEAALSISPYKDKETLLFSLQLTNEYISSFYNDNRIPNHGFDSITKELKLLKLADIIKLNNFLFTHATINKNTPPVFNDYFIFKDLSQHPVRNNHNVFRTLPGSLEIPLNECKSSLKYICSIVWNAIHI